jgi:ATP adenylyltransferase
VKREVSASLLRQYQHLAIFEHGPSSPNGSVGCSVDHAHLHFVPIDFDLLAAAKPFLPAGTNWSSATWEDCRDAHVNGNDYLYLEQPHDSGQIASGSSFGSQIFRRAIAAQIGVPEQFNWRQHPNFENIARTIQSAALACDGAMSR